MTANPFIRTYILPDGTEYTGQVWGQAWPGTTISRMAPGLSVITSMAIRPKGQLHLRDETEYEGSVKDGKPR